MSRHQHRPYDQSPPVAILVSVDGTPDGDYLVPLRHPAEPAGAGETLLAQWQVNILMAEGYTFA